jgi:hypothetical protein
MSNIQTGNIIFLDSSSASFAGSNIRLVGLIVHCTHGSTAAEIKLSDNNSGRSYPTILHFEVPAASDFADFDFSTRPIVFPNGIRVVTLSNCTATLILDRNVENVR